MVLIMDKKLAESLRGQSYTTFLNVIGSVYKIFRNDVNII